MPRIRPRAISSICWRPTATRSSSHTIFKPVVPVKELFEQILNIGATQHYAIVDGDYRPQLEALAEMMGFEYYEL